MFRLMNSRKTVMIEPEITVTLSLNEKDKKGEYKRQFYKLKLERDKIMYLPTIWTIVHEIDKESPLQKYSKKEIAELDGELVYFSAISRRIIRTKSISNCIVRFF